MGAALAWSKEKYGLKVNSLAAGEKEKWDALISPMVDEWIKDMTSKGYDARGLSIGFTQSGTKISKRINLK